MISVQISPSVMAPFAAAQRSSASPANSPSSGATLDPNSAEETFMKLLVTELQSQDPTSPMDPTAMVGQMFSMNQLQQLIDINKTLSAVLDNGQSNGASSVAPSNLHNTTPASVAASSYLQQLPIGAH